MLVQNGSRRLIARISMQGFSNIQHHIIHLRDVATILPK